MSASSHRRVLKLADVVELPFVTQMSDATWASVCRIAAQYDAVDDSAKSLTLPGLVRFASLVADGSEAAVTALEALHGELAKSFGCADVHVAAALTNDKQTAEEVIEAFVRSTDSLRKAGHVVANSDAAASNGLVRAVRDGDAKLYALFGGQGNNEVYFSELRTLYRIYGPLLISTVEAATVTLQELGKKYRDTEYYEYGFDLFKWLQSEETSPPTAYLASCPVSLPLIGLTQLCQYVAYGRMLGLGPASVGKLFDGATGHSQGIVAAVVISMADDESWVSFDKTVVKAIEVLFQVGLQGQTAFGRVSVAPGVAQTTEAHGDGTPTPMLAITGLDLKTIETAVKSTNEIVGRTDAGPGRASVSVSLHNGLRQFVATGHPADLVGLAETLRKIRAEPGVDQTRVPFSKRKPVFHMRFLPIGVPYHSPLLTGATDKALAELPHHAGFWSGSKLRFAVFNTETGADLRNEPDLLRSMFDQIHTAPIHWHTAATVFKSDATHAIDFGTGGMSGIGSLCSRNWEGRAVRVIMIGARVETATGAGFEAWKKSIKKDDKWSEKYAPKLVRTTDGKIVLSTPMSRLLRKPPLMVAGMTPTTVQAGFVAAVMNAGFHVELAGGGHYNAAALRSKIEQIRALTKPGVALTLNALYINQRQWSFQLPLWVQMSKEGLPVDGFTAAAGVPSAEKAAEIIALLKEGGIRHISFKPGSVASIRAVVAIAKANPEMAVMLQWTGGRAGGHHSCEDVHSPILSTYESIRSCANIVLVAGSGFGGADDCYPYLNGSWSEQFNVERMPFDGFLFGSRVMVAKEAHTSEAVKQLIVNAAGTTDAKWEESYDKPVGGIITVTSELGEPIHKVATRGVKFWAELDKKVFSLPKDKQLAWLLENKKYVVDRLNADFQKPWFGQKADGTVCDLDEMTYGEVTDRLVRLMYVKDQRRWIDKSLRNCVGDWLRRIEERMVENAAGCISQLQTFDQLDDPHSFLELFYKAFPQTTTQVLASADVAYFLAIVQRPGQKPVPFIPVLDAMFSVWFKKDSLWQAEDLDAVFDRDPERVCILQGPVAAAHCKRTDEPIGELLGGIEAGLIKQVLAEYYNNDEKNVPVAEYLADEPQKRKLPSGITLVKTEAKDSVRHVYSFTGAADKTEWLEYLTSNGLGWLRAVTMEKVVSDGEFIASPINRILEPRPGQTIEVAVRADGKPLSVDVYAAED